MLGFLKFFWENVRKEKQREDKNNIKSKEIILICTFKLIEFINP